MYQGTTPTIVFSIESNIDMSLITNAWATIAVASVQVTKKFEDIVIDPEENTVSVYLTQEDTLKFPAGNARLQLRLLALDGSAYATPILSLPVEKILEGGVLE